MPKLSPKPAPAAPAPAAPRRGTRWLGTVAVAATAALMLRWSWGTWPDVLVDFGQQLYIPWRLSEGEVLYRDLAYYNGPLSPYANAALFRLFGVGLGTLVAANLGLLALLVGLLFHVFERAGGRGAAGWAVFGFVLLFAFAQYRPVGNYNYVCPYAHEMTHGLVLALAALACVWRYPRGGVGWLVPGGLALGLAFLTKAEVFQAALAGVGVALGLALLEARPGRARAFRHAGVFAAAALGPPLAAFVALCLAMPAQQAAAGTAGSWVGVFNPRLVSSPFFRGGMGLDDPSGNLRRLLGWSAGYALVFVPAVLAGLRLRAGRRARLAAAAVAFLAAIFGLRLGVGTADWLDAFRPLPLLMLLAMAVAAARVARAAPGSGADDGRAGRQVALAVFALAMLGKMILNAHIYHYGFVLAMPATLIVLAVVMDMAPSAIDRAGGSGAVLRAVAAAALLVVASAHLGRQAIFLSAKTHRVGSGADAFWADARGAFVSDAVGEIVRRFPAEATLTPLPEGVMLNYLARRRTPSRFTAFLPTEVVLFGEDTMLDDLRAHPPDLVALVHKDTSESGVRFFGTDFGRPLLRWVEGAYVPRLLLGAPPFRGNAFGIAILERDGR